jgi:hypothetical protein
LMGPDPDYRRIAHTSLCSSNSVAVSSTEPLDIIAKPLFWSMVSILGRA